MISVYENSSGSTETTTSSEFTAVKTGPAVVHHKVTAGTATLQYKHAGSWVDYEDSGMTLAATNTDVTEVTVLGTATYRFNIAGLAVGDYIRIAGAGIGKKGIN